MNAILAKRTIGVMGSGTDEYEPLAGEVGRLLARLGVNVLTGAGQGVMLAVSRAFTRAERASGICIGIVPCSQSDPTRAKEGYPNKFVELPIHTHLPLSGLRGCADMSRNHINILSSAAIIALPGGPGTRSEVELALKYRRAIIAYPANSELVAAFPEAALRANTIEEVEAFLAQHLT